MSPMDWFFMSALRLAPMSKAPTRLAPVRSAAMRPRDRLHRVLRAAFVQQRCSRPGGSPG
jgi:hypothetical protein